MTVAELIEALRAMPPGYEVKKDCDSFITSVDDVSVGDTLYPSGEKVDPYVIL